MENNTCNSVTAKNGTLIAALAFICLSLSVTYYYNCYMMVTWGPVDKFSVYAFKSFSKDLDTYTKYMDATWRPRLFANYLAGFVIPFDSDRDLFADRVGIWSSAWLFLTLCAYIAWDRRRAPYLIFGTFACLYYAFTIMADRHIYPWDMPALFFYVLLGIAVHRRNAPAVFLIAVIGTGFKETVALGGLAFLFWEGLPLRRRVAFALGTLAACGLLKIGIDILTKNPSIGITMQFYSDGPLVLDGVKEKGILYNLAALTRLYLNHPVFINGGTFLIFLCLPVKDREDLTWKAVGVSFLVGNLFCAVINEYRVFHEMIPVSLWAIQKHFKLFDG
ncbi:MAG: hypothetical protein V2B18_02990 [Pseudomonadota bacterium]